MSQTPQTREVEAGMCRCGCNSKAVYRCKGFDFDPAAKGGKGAAYVEDACFNAAHYMRDASAELGFRFAMTPIGGSNDR